MDAVVTASPSQFTRIERSHSNYRAISHRAVDRGNLIEKAQPNGSGIWDHFVVRLGSNDVPATKEAALTETWHYLKTVREAFEQLAETQSQQKFMMLGLLMLIFGLTLGSFSHNAVTMLTTRIVEYAGLSLCSLAGSVVLRVHASLKRRNLELPMGKKSSNFQLSNAREGPDPDRGGQDCKPAEGQCNECLAVLSAKGRRNKVGSELYAQWVIA